MFQIRRLENSCAGGQFYRLRVMIRPNSPYDEVYVYGKKGLPPHKYKFKPKKSYFLWTDEKWRRFLKNNFGSGRFYIFWSGGFFLSAYVIYRKGNKTKIKKKLSGTIVKLFLDEVD